ncbi:hypothetical protein [Wenjunlia vitaminophila]|uniref:hypothetical protein n=1 Tax=Wenjunlia vitaminophila TaxID=76728 RepID=UPI000A636264|nr:hypothetical protein [Wenjunlia vitaminophila]
MRADDLSDDELFDAVLGLADASAVIHDPSSSDADRDAAMDQAGQIVDGLK